MRLKTVTNLRIFCMIASIVLFVLCNIALIILKVIPFDQNIELVINKPKCYEFSSGLVNATLLDDILTVKIAQDGKSIFFLVTACSKTNTIAFNSRYFQM